MPKSTKTAFLEKFEILMGFYSAMNYSYWKKHEPQARFGSIHSGRR